MKFYSTPHNSQRRRFRLPYYPPCFFMYPVERKTMLWIGVLLTIVAMLFLFGVLIALLLFPFKFFAAVLHLISYLFSLL